MKFELLHGRSGALRNTHKFAFRLSSLVLLAALSAPALADSDLPTVRSTDVQSVSASAPQTSVLAGLDNTTLPHNLQMMPSGPAAVTASSEKEGRVQQLLKRALTLLGTPYRWGGTDPDNGLDCSGLVGYVFRSTLGLDLPRISRDLARAGQPILSRDQITPGDLVFFGLRGRVNHVGIYLGEGRFLHAPRRGEDVRIDNFNSRYWQARYMGARRVGL